MNTRSMSAPNVLVCLPTHHDDVHINFAFSLMETARALSDAGCGFQTMHVGSSHVIRARNFFASYFVAHAEFSHLLFLDTDMQFPPQAVIKLLAAGKAVAGVAYPYRRMNLDKRIGDSDQGLTLREWLEKHADYTVRLKTSGDGRASVTDGLVEAEHVGTGIFSRGAMRSRPRSRSRNATSRPSNTATRCPMRASTAFSTASKKRAAICPKTCPSAGAYASAGRRCGRWSIRRSCTTARRKWPGNICARCACAPMSDARFKAQAQASAARR